MHGWRPLPPVPDLQEEVYGASAMLGSRITLKSGRGTRRNAHAGLARPAAHSAAAQQRICIAKRSEAGLASKLPWRDGYDQPKRKPAKAADP